MSANLSEHSLSRRERLLPMFPLAKANQLSQSTIQQQITTRVQLIVIMARTTTSRATDAGPPALSATKKNIETDWEWIFVKALRETNHSRVHIGQEWLSHRASHSNRVRNDPATLHKEKLNSGTELCVSRAATLILRDRANFVCSRIRSTIKNLG